ncbi:MAG: lysoplasmalogenase, partial [Cyclobacteriaceae bacterium]|nr:lysoplasmalogenase [Cyclobacteriaceae bacterium]
VRMEQTNQSSFNQVFFGAILFMISDSLLGLNKFLLPIENAQLFILMTYMLAQWNIVNGLLKHFNEK